MNIIREKGFTLLELMIVIAILGILATSLFPSYSNYITRGRDTTRIADIDTLAKIIGLYYSDNEKYPNHDNGCVNEIVLASYAGGKGIPRDPKSAHANGCTTLGRYSYASGSFAFNPNVFSLLAIMEMPTGGNYSGSLVGFTGTLTSSAYNSGLTLTNKGGGQSYVFMP